ncbi:hypothetical protein C0991_004033 [Blastosporella zonata]|nr:hypothetical protein C0991_004033 [Blastosporella zonata]
MKRANSIAYVATPSGDPILASALSRERAISLRRGVDDTLYYDESRTVPIYNYARFLSWVQAVEDVSDMFRAASERAHIHLPVNPREIWEKEERDVTAVHPKNRIGTRGQIEHYCLPLGESPYERTAWGPNVFSRILIASSIALSLQWGTTGAAMIVVWFTPTTGKLLNPIWAWLSLIRKRRLTGLSCRSGGYLLYGALSTVVWMLLLVSSFLSHYVSMTSYANTTAVVLARWTAIAFRRLGKTLAAFNAIWIVVSCLFQFSNFFDRCYCNSSVLTRGVTTWTVIVFITEDVASMRGAWIGGVVLAAGSASLFVLFVNLFINPQLPE